MAVSSTSSSDGMQTNARALALSEQHASTISTPVSWYWELPSTGIASLDDATLLHTATCAILAQSFLDQTVPGTALLVYEENKVLQRAIKIQAVARGVQPYFTTGIKSEATKGQEAHFLHRWASNRSLAELIPSGVSAIARFDNESNSVFLRVKALSPDAVCADISTLIRSSALLPQQGEVHTTLQIANGIVSQLADSSNEPINTIRIEAVPKTPIDVLTGLHVVDWTGTQKPPVPVQSASSQINLSAQKTYILVGIANDLGQSVAQWMISRGARKVVMTSRTPKVEPSWLYEMGKLGARVIVMVMDVTDRDSILLVDREIRHQLPPIGGVVNGAMVLTDSLFSELTLDDIHATFKPKVEGSLLLDEIYNDPNLDFFILFGSLVSTIGNWSQSAYSVATNFLTSFVHDRRQRNQVGSVICPGAVGGVGYVSRHGRALSEHMSNVLGSRIVSERELHGLFAEAILAGPPDSGRNPDIIASMSTASLVDQPNVLWYTNPKAWDFVQYHASMSSQTVSVAAAPLRVQLESAQDVTETTSSVMESLVLKLRTKLHLSQDRMIDPDTRLAELEVDSLVAVDLRMWLSKELEVDVAVLQILGGSCIEQIAGTAASKLWQGTD